MGDSDLPGHQLSKSISTIQWVHVDKEVWFLPTDSEDSGQTWRMPRRS